MPVKRINPRLIKLHHCYSVEEASARLGVHKNTVRGWQRDGLEAIDQSRPVLFPGKALRAYLIGKRMAAKRPCPPGMLYCFKCRTHRPPALDMLDYIPRNGTSGNLSALCATCGTVMNVAARLATLPLKMPGMAVQIREGKCRIA
jgi:hypothetical protein